MKLIITLGGFDGPLAQEWMDDLEAWFKSREYDSSGTTVWIGPGGDIKDWKYGWRVSDLQLVRKEGSDGEMGLIKCGKTRRASLLDRKTHLHKCVLPRHTSSRHHCRCGETW